MAFIHLVTFALISLTSLNYVHALISFICEKGTGSYTLPACISDCNGLNILDTKINVSILHPSQIDDFHIFECTKVQRKVSLTETWTFSKLPAVVEYHELPISLLECKAAKTKICGDVNYCESRPPKMQDDYNWASTSVIIDEYVMIKTFLTTARIKTHETSQVVTKLGSVPIDQRFIQSSDQCTVIFWDDYQPSGEICPFKLATLSECLVTDNQGYVCPHLGLLLHKNKSSKSHDCNVKIYIDKGLIFTDEQINDIKYEDGNITLSNPLIKFADDVGSAFKVSEFRACVQDCFEMIRTPPYTITASPNGYLLKDATIDTYHECHQDPTCHITEPPLYCEPLNAIKVTCSMHQGWLNLSNLIMSEHVCPRDVETIISSTQIKKLLLGTLDQESFAHRTFIPSLLKEMPKIEDTESNIPIQSVESVISSKKHGKTSVPIITYMSMIYNKCTSFLQSLTNLGQAIMIIISITAVIIGTTVIYKTRKISPQYKYSTIFLSKESPYPNHVIQS
ncbi:TPA_asm: G [Bouteloa betacytorhabdovirus 1]|nr:TPA_asm: G [Bouteloa betacytorhabdovirus 1]